MPLFIRHRLLFIHIPKCGGDTITYALKQRGDPPFLFVADGSVMVNGHTPQHMTWQELQASGWSTPPGFRVAALVRHPIHRAMSAFRYIQTSRPDLVRYAPDSKTFLDHFLANDDDAFRRFDYHNRDILSFISNNLNEIHPDIYIQPVEQMNVWLHKLNLPQINTHERRNVTQGRSDLSGFTLNDIDRVISRYYSDIQWFEARFPRYRFPAHQHGL
jgi:hypothetical protein